MAVTCDIEQMFHDFYVNPKQRDLLRFLWFKDNDLAGQIVEYRINVHLFSAVSSTGVTTFGLRMRAETGRGHNDFYVDDGLKSFTTPDSAISVIQSTQAMCAAVNLHLHKFASNSKAVLEALPTEDLQRLERFGPSPRHLTSPMLSGYLLVHRGRYHRISFRGPDSAIWHSETMCIVTNQKGCFSVAMKLYCF